jgi:hypothetical protein
MDPTTAAKQELIEIGRRYQAVRTQFDAFVRGLRTAVEPVRPGVPPFDPIPSLAIKSAEGPAAVVEYLGNVYRVSFDTGLSAQIGVYGVIQCHRESPGWDAPPRLLNRFPVSQEGEVTIPGGPTLRAANDALAVFRYLVQEQTS